MKNTKETCDTSWIVTLTSAYAGTDISTCTYNNNNNDNDNNNNNNTPQRRLQYKMSTIEIHTKAYKTVSTLPVDRFSSRLTKTISREVNITFCIQSTF